MLKELYEMVWEELDGAEHYAKCAATYKDSYPQLAKVFHDLSQQELIHSNLLYDESVRLMKEHPHDAGSQAIHDFVREMQVEKGSRVKRLHSQYKT